MSIKFPTLEHYQLLEVTAATPINQITKSFRKLSLKYHPDKTRNRLYHEKYKLITTAYEIVFKYLTSGSKTSGPSSSANNSGSRSKSAEEEEEKKRKAEENERKRKAEEEDRRRNVEEERRRRAEKEEEEKRQKEWERERERERERAKADFEARQQGKSEFQRGKKERHQRKNSETKEFKMKEREKQIAIEEALAKLRQKRESANSGLSGAALQMYILKGCVALWLSKMLESVEKDDQKFVELSWELGTIFKKRTGVRESLYCSPSLSIPHSFKFRNCIDKNTYMDAHDLLEHYKDQVFGDKVIKQIIPFTEFLDYSISIGTNFNNSVLLRKPAQTGFSNGEEIKEIHNLGELCISLQITIMI
ncbi:hypothetical protein KGF54_003816 [Candida jiufengensis]|uniref:uncharacterized protein n=1 Tax=Candida jiufengensis TaxID=497108 RepID=UPI002225934A|nr:uncharacterized protein KGF54_003816 [Candida jiufengensis]KAI5950742.1 hypothetical protein KGF54_003816 [Candida jiufengensis]